MNYSSQNCLLKIILSLMLMGWVSQAFSFNYKFKQTLNFEVKVYHFLDTGFNLKELEDLLNVTKDIFHQNCNINFIPKLSNLSSRSDFNYLTREWDFTLKNKDKLPLIQIMKNTSLLNGTKFRVFIGRSFTGVPGMAFTEEILKSKDALIRKYFKNVALIGIDDLHDLLNVRKIRSWDSLMAHELSHLLGLDHSEGKFFIFQNGQNRNVMDAGNYNSGNSRFLNSQQCTLMRKTLIELK